MRMGGGWREIGQKYCCSSAEARTCNRGRIRCSLLVNSNQFYSCSLLITNQSGFKRERGRVVGGWDPLTKQAQIIEINKLQHINDNKIWLSGSGGSQSGHTVRKAHETLLLRLHLLGWKVLLIKKISSQTNDLWPCATAQVLLNLPHTFGSGWNNIR